MQLWQLEEWVDAESIDPWLTSIHIILQLIDRHDELRIILQKKGKKKGNDKTVGAIIESVDESNPIDTSSVECDPTADDDPESEDSNSLDASIFSVDEESNVSSELEDVSSSPDGQETMEHVLAMVESKQEADRFDLDADEEEYYNECEAAFNDEIIGVVMTEETETPSYKQDAYPEIDPDREEFKGIREMWCGEFSPSISEKMELEQNFFTGSDWFGNAH